MALPQNPFSDTILLNTLRTQNDSIGAQTKVLHKLSDSIMDQRKEFAQLRKDIQRSQKEFFMGSDKGLSSIQKYFEKYKSDNTKQNVRGKEDPASTGFFKSAINKLFGPSKYQQKMIEETVRIRELSESSALSLSFIRSTMEDGPRARERELLAKLIADKLGREIQDSQGGGGPGFLSTMLDVLIKGSGVVVGFLGSVVVPLIGNVISGLAAVGTAIVGGLVTLGEQIIAALLGAGLGAGLPGGGGGKGGGGRGGRYGPNQLPGGKELPQLEGPRKPIDMGELKQNRAGVYTPGGAGGGIGMRPGLFGLGAIASGMAGMLEQDEINSRIEQEKSELPTFGERWNSIKWFDDANGKGDKPGEAWNKIFNPERIKQAEDSQEGMDKQTSMLEDTSKRINDSLKKMLEEFEDFPKKMEKAVIDGYLKAEDAIKGTLNSVGMINFGHADKNGGVDQTVNLLPGLGEAIFDTLHQAYNEAEALTNKIAPNASMFSSNITQNIDNKGTTISASQISAEGAMASQMNRYMNRNARVR